MRLLVSILNSLPVEVKTSSDQISIQEKILEMAFKVNFKLMKIISKYVFVVIFVCCFISHTCTCTCTCSYLFWDISGQPTPPPPLVTLNKLIFN